MNLRANMAQKRSVLNATRLTRSAWQGNYGLAMGDGRNLPPASSQYLGALLSKPACASRHTIAWRARRHFRLAHRLTLSAHPNLLLGRFHGLRRDANPLFRIHGPDQLPPSLMRFGEASAVMPENHLRTISRLQRHLRCARHRRHRCCTYFARALNRETRFGARESPWENRPKPHSRKSRKLKAEIRRQRAEDGRRGEKLTR